MPGKPYLNRLRKEYKEIKKNPPPHIVAAPLAENILEWHYVLHSLENCPYSGGFYHGKVVFPPEYPYKPPAIYMITPNGRFQTSIRLCLSMSDYHPDQWNPAWSVDSILKGLLSFMLESHSTAGSITTTDAQKRSFAISSAENVKNDPICQELFPEILEMIEERGSKLPPVVEKVKESKPATVGLMGNLLVLGATILFAIIARSIISEAASE